jgi:hypothetical protein
MGPDNPKTLMAQSNLALSFVNEGRGTEAIAILEPTLKTIADRKLGFMESRVRRNLGRAFLVEKNYPEAERELLQAYQLAESRHEARNMSQVAESLAMLYDALHRPNDSSLWRKRITAKGN